MLACGVRERVRTDDGSWTLESERYGETFRSRRGAVREARHVFVEGSGVAARLAARQTTTVLEIGLGTAVNLVLSASTALRHEVPLRYVAIEHEPLCAEAFEAVELEHVGDAAFVAAFLAWRRMWSDAGPDASLRHGAVQVDVLVADAASAPLPGAADALYLDGFSPRVNPELWTDEAVRRYAVALAPGGTLATYSVSGHVRRALAACGLAVERLPGPPGGKREMLRATRAPCAP
ncbi:MAG: tRNA (5-methylaminomethyl-2-thiouridine)(34)-methyltransferase MnmD [Trueperaceae bacterium]|nr:tRNA (5-methylaminomethyl-2-thiouridine)(34)-methyltransferase MnmD [Trueperaceae bacterium]